MATVSNIQNRLRRSTKFVYKTESATLTLDELKGLRINLEHATTPVAVTIPDGDTSLDGVLVLIQNTGAQDATVVYAAGFGGGDDTITLLQGEMTGIMWNQLKGTWTFCNSTTAA